MSDRMIQLLTLHSLLNIQARLCGESDMDFLALRAQVAFEIGKEEARSTPNT